MLFFPLGSEIARPEALQKFQYLSRLGNNAQTTLSRQNHLLLNVLDRRLQWLEVRFIAGIVTV